MSNKRYMIHNTTRKPADLDEAGNDNRTQLEKGGHAVSFRDEDGKSRMIPAGGAPAFTSKLDQGLISLQAEGSIRIEEFKDVSSAMEAHAINSARGNHGRAGTAGEKKQRNILLEPEHATAGVSGAPGTDRPSKSQDGDKEDGKEDGKESREERMASREKSGRDGQLKSAGAKATKTGEEDHTPRGGRETDEAVNPDGEPNFLAKTKDVVRTKLKGNDAR